MNDLANQLKLIRVIRNDQGLVNYNHHQQSQLMFNHRFISFSKYYRWNLRIMIHSEISRFSTEKIDSNHGKQKYSQDRLQKQKQIQFRRRSMENAEIKMINDRIDTTKGNFNPIIAYIKLYKNQFTYLMLIATSLMFVICAFMLIGTYQDPFSKKKKLVLVSDKYERSIDSLLRQIVQSQLNGQFTEASSSSTLNKKSKQLQQFTKVTTGRQYKTVIVQSQDQIITILPQSIIISKNILLSKSIKMGDIENVIILLQTLFAQKLHIKELAPSYILFFLKLKLRGTSTSDIKLTTIYSRSYSQSQIETALNHIENNYNLPADIIKNSLSKLTELTDGNNIQSSPFALKNRFKAFI